MARKLQDDDASELDMEDLVRPPPRRATKKAKKETGGGTDVVTAPSTSGSSAVPLHYEKTHDFDMKELRDVRENLLRWYDAHRRKLPWRGDLPPYLTTATHTKQTAVVKAKMKKAGTMDAFLSASVKIEDGSVKHDSASADALKSEEGVVPITFSEDIAPRKVSPYETWVSEIMLQQTRVDTVVDYFLRWTEKFPTVDALANGSEEVRIQSCNMLAEALLTYWSHARTLRTSTRSGLASGTTVEPGCSTLARSTSLRTLAASCPRPSTSS